MIVPDGWIRHDDKRVHDPILSDQCWRCLQAEVERLRAAIGLALLDLTDPVDADACRDELSRALKGDDR